MIVRLVATAEGKARRRVTTVVSKAAQLLLLLLLMSCSSHGRVVPLEASRRERAVSLELLAPIGGELTGGGRVGLAGSSPTRDGGRSRSCG